MKLKHPREFSSLSRGSRQLLVKFIPFYANFRFTTAEELMNNVYPMISAERAAQRKQAEESKTVGRIIEIGLNLKGQHTLTFTLPSIFFKNGVI